MVPQLLPFHTSIHPQSPKSSCGFLPGLTLHLQPPSLCLWLSSRPPLLSLLPHQRFWLGAYTSQVFAFPLCPFHSSFRTHSKYGMIQPLRPELGSYFFLWADQGCSWTSGWAGSRYLDRLFCCSTFSATFCQLAPFFSCRWGLTSPGEEQACPLLQSYFPRLLS
jgi:hypothetical protein